MSIERRAAGVFAVELGHHQPVLFAAIVAEPLSVNQRRIVAMGLPFSMRHSILGPGELKAPKVCADEHWLRASGTKGNIAAQVALQIQHIKTLYALALPNAAFALIVVKFKGLAFCEVEVGINAGDLPRRCGRGNREEC